MTLLLSVKGLEVTPHGLQALQALCVQAHSAALLFQVHAADEVARAKDNHRDLAARVASPSALVDIAEPHVKLAAVIAPAEEGRSPAGPRDDQLDHAALDRASVGSLQVLAPEQEHAHGAAQERRQRVGALGQGLEDLPQNAAALPGGGLAPRGYPLQALARAAELMGQEQLRGGRQRRREVQALGALARGVQHRKLRPRVRSPVALRPVCRAAATELGGGAIGRELQHAIEATQRSVVPEEGREGGEERSHGPLAALERPLVGLGEGADVHGHEEPSNRREAALLGARDLALPQPPLHAAQHLDFESMFGRTRRILHTCE
mmetsp:Transcript_36613/g.109330  ORF Transcript_36613/g.109330 Transcript_36613/m.109330 type:complete len:321 (-) Transcript_36613:1065-2027(-)